MRADPVDEHLGHTRAGCARTPCAAIRGCAPLARAVGQKLRGSATARFFQRLRGYRRSQPMMEPSERLRLAFQWIAHERTLIGAAPIDILIDRASARFDLTPAQVIWARWSLQPSSVAVHPKEPTP
jgi:hypothetical protein